MTRARLVAFALASAALTLSSLSRAKDPAETECLKDADCPGEGICEDGSCVTSQGPTKPAPPKDVAKADDAPKTYAKPEEAAPKGGVLVTFDPDGKDQHWALETASAEPVCQLPCKRWVGPTSGLRLRLQAETAEEQQLLALPDDFGFAAGDKLRAVAVPARKVSWPWVGSGIGIAALGVVLVGVGLPLALVDCKSGSGTATTGAVSGGMTTGASQADTSVPAGCDPHNLDPQYKTNPGLHTSTGFVLATSGAGSIVLGACLALIAGVTWSPRLTVRRESAKAGGPTLAITPDGLGGSF